MIVPSLVVFSVVAVVGLQASLVAFPPDFKFGAATAAYQIEGAWNESDKSASVWDELTHRRRDQVDDGSDGDVACDSYHQWERDIQMAKELGLDYYRFSLSWTRLCPKGICNVVNKDGVRYYNQLINGLLAKGIEPVITLYHWDLPQRLQYFGGWANPLIADWFASYARVVFQLFADRVKTFITINEPMIVCDGVYSGMLAPIIKDPLYGAYQCTKNVLLAHARAWRIYDEEFRAKYHGQVSLSNYLLWFESRTPSDQGLAELALEQSVGRYSHPIFSKEGGWPPALEKLIAENSRKQGYTRSRLPGFTKEEKKLVRGTYDFFGVNYYTSRVVRPLEPGEVTWSVPLAGSEELGAVFEYNPEWKNTSIEWMKQNPKGLRKHLIWLKQQYGDLTFLITENGFPSDGLTLKDEDRIQWMKDHLEQVMLAIRKDGVKVKAYTAWSLMDNFEWRSGYMPKFGLYEVNFTDPQRQRTARSSAHFYAQLIDARALEMTEEYNSSSVWAVLGAALAICVVATVLYKCCKRRNKSKNDEYTNVALQYK